MTIEISAVICTRNRAGFFVKCLDSLLKQTLDRDRYEILVVDNGSTDDTAAVARAAGSVGNIRYIYEPVVGLSRARNRGWQEAEGEYLGYIDDDAVAVEHWLEDALRSFLNVHPQPDWVGGPIELEWEVPNPGWIDDELAVPLGRVHWGDEPRFLHFPECLGGGNGFFLKNRLKEMGGFDERLGRQGGSLLSGEETQLQQRIETAGGVIYYHPGVMVYHFVPVSRTMPSWFYRRYFWGGVSDFFIQRTMDGHPAQPTVAADGNKKGRAGRLVHNLLLATGFFVSRSTSLHARIYLSYVLGYLSGFFHWRRA